MELKKTKQCQVHHSYDQRKNLDNFIMHFMLKKTKRIEDIQ